MASCGLDGVGDWVVAEAVAKGGAALPFVSGFVITVEGAGWMWVIGRMITKLPDPLRWIAEVAILKTTFSLSGLVNAAGDVEAALENDDLDEARKWVSWHLVSRDTSALDESQVVAATVESLAENLSDGVIAPLFFYRMGGLPAALAYRYVNTCDSMLGYRDAEREWLGKFPARFDDVLNFVPARLTALGILGVGWVEGWFVGSLDGKPAEIYWRDNRTTDSPNAGHPMSAMAGALDVELEKVGQYRLGAGLKKPVSADIRRAIHMLYKATGAMLGRAVFLARGA